MVRFMSGLTNNVKVDGKQLKLQEISTHETNQRGVCSEGDRNDSIF